MFMTIEAVREHETKRSLKKIQSLARRSKGETKEKMNLISSIF